MDGGYKHGRPTRPTARRPRQYRSGTGDSVRRCYEPCPSMVVALLSMRHANATTCSPASVMASRSWSRARRRQLDYKMAWCRGVLLAVPPHHTSQTCTCCGHPSKDNRQTRASFLCVDCSYENYTDVVGAINILARGHRVVACGELVQSGPLMKQEPTEAPRRSAHGAIGIPVL